MKVAASDYFSRKELQCKHTGNCEMEVKFLLKLDALRELYGQPIHLSSAYRDPSHPVEAKKAKPGKHAQGRAVDILCFGQDAHRIIVLAISMGFKGIGVSQKGDFNQRFIHIDDRETPALWSY